MRFGEVFEVKIIIRRYIILAVRSIYGCYQSNNKIL